MPSFRYLTTTGMTTLALAVSLIMPVHSETVEAPETPHTASETQEKRNVILIIGDGMDDQQITMARNYLKGATGNLLLDDLPLRSTSQVLTVDNDAPDTAVYVADSANSATSMATGMITSRGRIGTSAGDDRDLTTIAELAKAAGYSTGIVTTSSVTDATPSSFIAHVAFRMCESPLQTVPREEETYRFDTRLCTVDSLAKGGQGSIAQQIAGGNHDIILGGGLAHFVYQAENSEDSVLQLAQSSGYQVVQNSGDLASLDPQRKVLGLFADKNLPVRLQGENGRQAEKPEPSLLRKIDWRVGSVELPAPMNCEANPAYGDTPSLQAMTESALEHLAAQDSKGFFLMIESASIDKQSHYRNPCGSIGELEQLNESLATALAFAEKQPNTLILVTADHGQAAQIIPDGSMFSDYGLAVYTPGHVARIRTLENQIMSVNYATNDFMIEEHTGTSVPLFSNREGIGRVPAKVTQPEIFTIMKDYLLAD